MLQPHFNWQSRPRALREFPEDTQVRLRLLDFNRTITISAEDQLLYVRRIGLNKFLWCGVESPVSEASYMGSSKAPRFN